MWSKKRLSKIDPIKAGTECCILSDAELLALNDDERNDIRLARNRELERLKKAHDDLADSCGEQFRAQANLQGQHSLKEYEIRLDAWMSTAMRDSLIEARTRVAKFQHRMLKAEVREAEFELGFADAALDRLPFTKMILFAVLFTAVANYCLGLIGGMCGMVIAIFIGAERLYLARNSAQRAVTQAAANYTQKQTKLLGEPKP